MEKESVENYLPLQQNSYGGLRKFIQYYKKNNIRIPEAILKAGVKLIQSFRGRLGDEYFLVLEDIFHAAIECQQFEIAKFALTKLKDKFDNAHKILKLNGTYQEAIGDKEEAEKIYDFILSENPLSIEVQKRKIALLRTDGEISQAIEELNKFLQANLCDREAWLELADMYLEKLNYQKALFCYEQICLITPKNMHYFVRCAELNYTIGGVQNLQLARNYYTYVLHFEEDNLTALWGLLRTCKALEAAKKGDAKNKDLLVLVPKAIRKVYETKNPSLVASLPL